MSRKLLVLIALCLVACEKNSETLALNTSEKFIDLAVHIPGNWSKVCVLPPYTTNAMAKELLGFGYNVELNTNISTSDSITLLLTISGNTVLQAFEVNRRNADFSSLGAKCYPRSNAKFRLPDSGWPKVSEI